MGSCFHIRINARNSKQTTVPGLTCSHQEITTKSYENSGLTASRHPTWMRAIAANGIETIRNKAEKVE